MSEVEYKTIYDITKFIVEFSYFALAHHTIIKKMY